MDEERINDTEVQHLSDGVEHVVEQAEKPVDDESLASSTESLVLNFQKLMDIPTLIFENDFRSISNAYLNLCKSQKSDSLDQSLGFVEEALKGSFNIFNQPLQKYLVFASKAQVYDILKHKRKKGLISFISNLFSDRLNMTVKKYEHILNAFGADGALDVIPKIMSDFDLSDFMEETQAREELNILQSGRDYSINPNEESVGGSAPVSENESGLNPCTILDIGISSVVASYILNSNLLEPENFNSVINTVKEYLNLSEVGIERVKSLALHVRHKQQIENLAENYFGDEFFDRLEQSKFEFLSEMSKLSNIGANKFKLTKIILNDIPTNAFSIFMNEKNFYEFSRKDVYDHFNTFFDFFDVPKETREQVYQIINDKIIVDKTLALCKDLTEKYAHLQNKGPAIYVKQMIESNIDEVNDEGLKNFLKRQASRAYSFLKGADKEFKKAQYFDKFKYSSRSNEDLSEFPEKARKVYSKRDDMHWRVKTGSAGNANKKYRRRF